ncbi:MAG: hypothetical protein IJB74_07850 [Clostridia bacterium]|nr:hypothetical protein [Clostridia bacterium]MBQ7117034.1 hypothetical protein [Clostridia bacterium]
MMNKKDLKKSIDLIEPDPYMETRLKAKSIPKKTHSGAFGKAVASAITLCLVFAMIFGFNLTSPANTPTTSESQVSQQAVRQINPFIMVASAVEDESENVKREYKTLKLNDTFPFAYKVSFIDVRGMSESERTEAVNKADEMLTDIAENTKSEAFDYGIGCVRGGFENIIFIEVLANSIKLDLAGKEDIKSINVKNSSEWGYVEYYDWKLIEAEQEKGKTTWIPHGKEITITADQYHQDSGGFHWKNSDKLDNAINDNPDIPLSTFTDTITFTVEYNDGTKEIGVIDVSFDDEGNGTFTLMEYKEG